MHASWSPDIAGIYTNVLRGFGLTRSDLADRPPERGPLTTGPGRWERTMDGQAEAYVLFQDTLARSVRGIEAPRHYWRQAPAFQLSDVLAPYGYDVTFQALGGGEFEAATDPFEIVLADGQRSNETAFTYPNGHYGEDNYPALVQAIETRLLPRDDLTVVLLAGQPNAWQFVVVDREDLAELRAAYGPRIDVFDRPLLDDGYPAEYLEEGLNTRATADGEPSSTGRVPRFDCVVAADNSDDDVEPIERNPATEPSVPTAALTPDASDTEDEGIHGVDTAGDVGTTAVRDVSDNRPDDVLVRFKAAPPEVADASVMLQTLPERRTERTRGAGTDCKPVEPKGEGALDEAVDGGEPNADMLGAGSPGKPIGGESTVDDPTDEETDEDETPDDEDEDEEDDNGGPILRIDHGRSPRVGAQTRFSARSTMHFPPNPTLTQSPTA